MELNDFYKGKKVFVTGHTGFKGSWLSFWLTSMGARVKGYALEPNTNPNLFNELKLRDRIDSVIGDIRDYEKLLKAIKDFKPEIVFHLAAQPIVRRSYKEPRYTYETNIIGTVNLLEAIRKTKSVRSVVNVTSDKCYENKEWLWGYREIDQLGGHDPYSSSKACSELVTAAYRSSYFTSTEVSVATARAGNVIGGGDWAEDRLIPDIVRGLANNKTIVIRNPEATRPWQHVLDPLYGYLLLGKKLSENGQKFASAWNFSPSVTDLINVERIVKKSIELWGTGSYKIENSEQPHEANRLNLDASKSSNLLGWKPRINMEEAIKMTINWYKEYYSNKRIYELTKTQINRFLTDKDLVF